MAGCQAGSETALINADSLSWPAGVVNGVHDIFMFILLLETDKGEEENLKWQISESHFKVLSWKASEDS